MNPTFRLSRIRAPRGTVAAILLLMAFFITFGIAVAGTVPLETAVEPDREPHAPVALMAALLNRGH